MKFTIMRSLLIHFALSVFASGAVAAAGDLDMTFDPGSAADGTVTTVAIRADKTLIGGSFSSYNGVTKNKIARLNADGSMDATFDTGSGTGAGYFQEVWAMDIQTDGKTIIGGRFTSYNGIPRRGIARLNTDGSLDTLFDPGAGVQGYSESVIGVICLPDGRIFVGGSFASYNGIDRRNVALLHADGSLDTTFIPGNVAENSGVLSVLLQPDGKIIIAGGYNNSSVIGIARLNLDGSLDQTFHTGGGPRAGAGTGYVKAMALQNDGKIVIGGEFTTYNEFVVKNVARLNEDGSFDHTFNSGSGFGGDVLSLLIQPDGKIIAGGEFLTYNDAEAIGVVRLKIDGSLDSTFGLTGFLNRTPYIPSVHAMALYSDGQLIIGGNFTSIEGNSRNKIARIIMGDVDGDGVEDAVDAFPLDPSEWYDTDNDSIGNNADTDDDGDGIPDAFDAAPLDANPALPLNGGYKGANITESVAPYKFK